VVSRLKCEHFTQLLGYCLELNNRIVLYQFATIGSLYDILHGTVPKKHIRSTYMHARRPSRRVRA
jgi:hypothetical protein